MKQAAKKSSPQPEVVFIPTAKLKLNPNNPRQIKTKEFESLVKSLEQDPEMFRARPILVSDRTGELVVIGGNMRLRAVKKLNMKEAPCFIMHGLTEEQEKRIAIKDNGAWGEWDWDALANAWGELPLNDWGLNIPADYAAVDGIDAPELASGDRSPFQQITFTLHDTQVGELDAAILKAKKKGGGKSKVNENGNGNAIAFIAEKFNRG